MADEYSRDEHEAETGEIDPREVTIDGEVEPVVLKIGTDGEAEADTPSPLSLVIASHFGVELEQVRRFIVVAEYEHDGGVSVSSAWSGATPEWDLRGLVAEAKRQTDAL
jgi:hypothetical protein